MNVDQMWELQLILDMSDSMSNKLKKFKVKSPSNNDWEQLQTHIFKAG